MSTNISPVDRVLRIIAGLVLISLVFWGPQTSWGLIGIIPLATALIGFCPAYRLLGICTLKNA
ncbi:MAG: YgaP family membrane protein [Hyphomicrobiales bacterium]